MAVWLWTHDVANIWTRLKSKLNHMNILWNTTNTSIVVQKLKYFGKPRSIPWLLMHWITALPGQHPWYCICTRHRSLTFTESSLTTCTILVLTNDDIENILSNIFPGMNSARQTLTCTVVYHFFKLHWIDWCALTSVYSSTTTLCN